MRRRLNQSRFQGEMRIVRPKIRMNLQVLTNSMCSKPDVLAKHVTCAVSIYL